MKKLLYLLFLLVATSSFAQIYNEDDKEGLRIFLRQPSAEAGKINAEQLGLQISDTLNWQTDETWVTKISGLTWNSEIFKKIKMITWYNKKISGTLDATKWTMLEKLSCSWNHLTNLYLSNNTALQILECYRNQLANLYISNCAVLYKLICTGNQLTNLDISNNTVLTDLDCRENQLTNLDISNNTALEYLDCSDNLLTNLDISNNTALEYLYCYWNQLTNLNISNNTALTVLNCYNNQLTNLDISNNTALESLDCSDNPLTNLDISNNPVLYYLYCSSNLLTSLDVNNNTIFVELNCYNNHLRLSDLFVFSKKINYQNNKRLGTQTMLPQNGIINVAFLPSQSMFNNVFTNYLVTQNGNPASESDYTISNGKIFFNTLGTYNLTMTNSAIVSHIDFPAKVIVEVTVLETEADATLSNIIVSEGALNPLFYNDVYNYRVNVYGEEITITATANNSNASVNGNGTFPLNIGDNEFKITVTSENGEKELEYIVIVCRKKYYNAIWNYHFWSSNSWTGTTTEKTIYYTICGDTIVNGYTYVKLYETWDTIICGNNLFSFIGYLRQDGQKIYYNGCLLYDFGVSVGDTVYIKYAYPNPPKTLIVQNIDTINGIKIIYLDGEYGFGDVWYEGIGSPLGLFWAGYIPALNGISQGYHLNCFKQNDTIKYLDNYQCGKCFCQNFIDIEEETINAETIQIYPNPTSGQIIVKTLRATSPHDDTSSLQIYDITGRIVQTQLIASQRNTNELTIDISNLQNGIYFLQIENEIFKIMKN